MQNIKAKMAHNSIVGLYDFFGTKWGLQLEVFYWLFISIFRPSITISSLVWWPGSQSVRFKKELRIDDLKIRGLYALLL
jgi:hypothetical protein